MHRAPSSSLLLQFLFVLIVSGISLSACSESVETVTLKEVRSLDLPVAVYTEIVWLDKETLVFKHRQPRKKEDEGVFDTFDDYQISVYRLDTHELREVTLPAPPAVCVQKAGQFGRLQSAPGNLFGYIYLCSKRSFGPISSILYLWDRENDLMAEYATFPKQLGEYPRAFKAGRFSFALDMSSLILESASGLSPELYHVDERFEMTPLFTEFERASGPSRSPDGLTIAFGANERYHFHTDDPKTWWQMNKIYWNPFDLFLSDADGSNARLVLPQAGALGNLTWSPDGECLFFTGSSTWGKEGIWMLHLDTLKGVRIWPYNSGFALSPDGRNIVLRVREKIDFDKTPTQITLFALPDGLCF